MPDKDVERGKFQEKLQKLTEILNELRPGTGEGIAVFILGGWDEGYEAALSRETAEPSDCLDHRCVACGQKFGPIPVREEGKL